MEEDEVVNPTSSTECSQSVTASINKNNTTTNISTSDSY